MSSKVIQFVSDYGTPLLLICIVGGLIYLAVLCMCWVWDGTSQWIGSINNPTERGLAYIAVAVVFHAFFGKSNVDVKVDGVSSNA